ncbi:cobaltochelatase CobT subunit [Hoeflea marina]|uniref:Cobaltochelatase CobT subunit n=1 Tax=Hoeflea marina TaxID=274592 RepID=A0A317PE77_9HYPH|nr:TIR domain-containing protein [Hoeflea marina]PWV97690.1 cobaltochelatase CobT subunit [Hoeflea marina]
MQNKDPLAFLSYVRDDDAHDRGRISDLRTRLEGEVRIQTGFPFPIFQDRNDIDWGERWRERIKEAIDSISFLIPIITPSYFRSHMCREEFEAFILRERALGLPRLILPIYYVTADEIDDSAKHPDDMAATLRERNWSDWRELRFTELDDSIIRKQIATLATTIKETMVNLRAQLEAATQSKLNLTQSLRPPPPPAEVTAPATVIAANPLAIPVARDEKASASTLKRAQEQPYYAYTTKFDEVISPRQLMSSDESLALHQALLKTIREQSLQFEDAIENGAAHIAGVANDQDISLSILIDNSGSMRGDKIRNVATWTSIASSIMSGAGLSNEILGFTTKAWKGGQSREMWLSDNKAGSPGRLNDLRHIVYKSFDETFQEADINFSLMIRDGLLKENIDGEALLWAYTRLQRRHAARKILVVLSDGAPVDDSTLSVNAGSFLHDHLQSSAGWIRSLDDVELYGVGIGYNVDAYYGQSSPTLDDEQIGPDLLNLLSLILRHDTQRIGAFQKAVERPAKLPESSPFRARKRRPRIKPGPKDSIPQ